MNNNKLASETIINLPDPEKTYKTVVTKLPDGTDFPQLFQLVKYPDGTIKWELTSERIKEFDKTFADTTTIPNNWHKTDTNVLEQKTSSIPHRETVSTVKEGGITRIDLRKILVLNLGDPQNIIRNKGLDPDRLTHFSKNKAYYTTLCMMAKEHGGEWMEASQFLHPEYPNTQK